MARRTLKPENLMEQVAHPENYRTALEAVKRNQGAPEIDGRKTTELEEHLQKNWEKIRAKLLGGTYIPSPLRRVRRVEIPKPNEGKFPTSLLVFHRRPSW